MISSNIIILLFGKTEPIMRTQILVIILLLIVNTANCQEAGGGSSDDPDGAVATAIDVQKGIIYGEGVEMVVSKGEELGAAIQDAKDTKEKIQETRKLYNYYKSCVDYVEMVSTNLRTRDEVKEIGENIARIISMYNDYGLNFKKMRTLYDFDKYVNPATYERYLNDMNDIYVHAVRTCERLGSVIGGKYITDKIELTMENSDFVKKGGTVSQMKFETDESKSVRSNWKMHETERYTIMIQANMELRMCINSMYRLVEDICHTYGTNRRELDYKEVMQSMFDYENYNYTVIR